MSELKLCKKCGNMSRVTEYLGVETINGEACSAFVSECGMRGCRNRFYFFISKKTGCFVKPEVENQFDSHAGTPSESSNPSIAAPNVGVRGSLERQTQNKGWKNDAI